MENLNGDDVEKKEKKTGPLFNKVSESVPAEFQMQNYPSVVK